MCLPVTKQIADLCGDLIGRGLSETMTTACHPLFARFYRRFAASMEGHGVAEHREELLASLSGRVIEVGAGTGLTFPHYPPEVSEVVAVEPEPYLRKQAVLAARAAPVPVRVVSGVAERLPVASGSFDAAVVSLVLCSVTDQARALEELARVLKPGGELRFYEHVRSDSHRFARVQMLVDRVWPWFAGGCHTSRDTLAGIAQAGFAIERVRRFRFPDTAVPAPTAPMVLGVARAP
jgi:ubiquinone/menaquinone biosynthesis C-methylase UbiE